MSLVTIQQAVDRLRQGDVVALPTETVYGLAARIDSEEALQKIFSVKQRPSFDPLIVHVSETQQARSLSLKWPEIYEALAEKFWPGPLTLVAPKSDAVSTTISSGLLTAAFRCPHHPIFLESIVRVGTPLAAPSANRFGRTSPTTAAHVEEEFDGQVAVVDGGACTVGVESTVLSAEWTAKRWQLKILRPGGVSRKELKDFLTEAQFKFDLTRESSMASPGNLKEHYQPLSPIALLNNQNWSPAICEQIEKKLKRKISQARELRLPATPQAAARILYAEFRRLSTDANQILWINRSATQSTEEWEVIWDRVERASTVIM
jgi:L-threonylcarbamoyladenylate synthase